MTFTETYYGWLKRKQPKELTSLTEFDIKELAEKMYEAGIKTGIDYGYEEGTFDALS